ncbi:Sideroflexin-3 [Halotydeus destructor]|nr:Sideroflexin-3 [Halotydeus destructor]
MSAVAPVSNRINLNEPRYDQSTYLGRAKHFFSVTNPLTIFTSSAELDKSRDIVTRYRNGEDIPGLSEDELWHHKNLYDSAHHPETGERQIIFGRMSAQVPMNMIISGCMLTFYKSSKEVIFWQWFNQSFNATVNYTNRSGEPMPTSKLITSYCLATGGALGTALGLNSVVKKAPPLVGRFVPFCAVAAANCVNIPMMRQKELKEGILIVDENGKKLGNSKIAAKTAISQVVLSRISMSVPGMLLPPILMNVLEKRGTLKRMPWISAPLQTLVAGVFLIFTTPLCCALFPQKSSVELATLEPELQEIAAKKGIKMGYYNKGL